jgi:hypothetical protein
VIPSGSRRSREDCWRPWAVEPARPFRDMGFTKSSWLPSYSDPGQALSWHVHLQYARSNVFLDHIGLQGDRSEDKVTDSQSHPLGQYPFLKYARECRYPITTYRPCAIYVGTGHVNGH